MVTSAITYHKDISATEVEVSLTSPCQVSLVWHPLFSCTIVANANAIGATNKLAVAVVSKLRSKRLWRIRNQRYRHSKLTTSNKPLLLLCCVYPWIDCSHTFWCGWRHASYLGRIQKIVTTGYLVLLLSKKLFLSIFWSRSHWLTTTLTATAEPGKACFPRGSSGQAVAQLGQPLLPVLKSKKWLTTSKLCQHIVWLYLCL